MPSGTIQYPSIGSIVSKELGTKDPAVPSYVVMGYPNITRDPGFLGAKYGYVYLTQTETGPNGFVRPPDVDDPRQDRRETLAGPTQPRLRKATSERPDHPGPSRHQQPRLQNGRPEIPERLRPGQRIKTSAKITAANSANAACWPDAWSNPVSDSSKSPST